MICARANLSFMSRSEGDKWTHSITIAVSDGNILCDSFDSDKPLSLVEHFRHWGVMYNLESDTPLGKLFNKPFA